MSYRGKTFSGRRSNQSVRHFEIFKRSTTRDHSRPITPVEVFNSDPTMTRTQNTVAGIRVFSCSQLNTPQPIMSACLYHPDPFRSGPHPVRDLGSPTWRILSSDSQVKSGQAVIQLTQEEDQTVTNLLKLHYQGPDVTGTRLPAAGTDLSDPAEPRPESSTTSSSEETHKAACTDAQYPRELGCWSEVEFEVAHILLNGFRKKELKHLAGASNHQQQF